MWWSISVVLVLCAMVEIMDTGFILLLVLDGLDVPLTNIDPPSVADLVNCVQLLSGLVKQFNISVEVQSSCRSSRSNTGGHILGMNICQGWDVANSHLEILHGLFIRDGNLLGDLVVVQDLSSPISQLGCVASSEGSICKIAASDNLLEICLLVDVGDGILVGFDQLTPDIRDALVLLVSSDDISHAGILDLAIQDVAEPIRLLRAEIIVAHNKVGVSKVLQRLGFQSGKGVVKPLWKARAIIQLVVRVGGALDALLPCLDSIRLEGLVPWDDFGIWVVDSNPEGVVVILP